jgi:hypothetical protein
MTATFDQAADQTTTRQKTRFLKNESADQRTKHTGNDVSNHTKTFAGHKLPGKPTGSHADQNHPNIFHVDFSSRRVSVRLLQNGFIRTATVSR